MLFPIASLVGCFNTTSEIETIEVAIVRCEEGCFVNNATYVSMANSAMIRKQYVQYSVYFIHNKTLSLFCFYKISMLYFVSISFLCERIQKTDIVLEKNCQFRYKKIPTILTVSGQN